MPPTADGAPDRPFPKLVHAHDPHSTRPLNPALARIPPSLIRTLSARKRADDVDLGLGEPTLRPDTAPFEAALAWVRENGCPYSPNAGFPELRAAIARYLGGSGPAPERAPRYGPDNVCVTVGSEEALYLAIKSVVDPRADEVLIVEPCYLAYPKLCMLEGIRHRMVALSPEDGFRPSAARVLAALRPDTRLVVVNSPGNPTGRIWPDAELRALAAGLGERDRPVYLLADEVYRELFYTARPPASAADFHPYTLVAGSLSKSNALTGLRLGWLAGPAEVIAAATKVHQFVNTAADTFAQRVAIELLRDPASLAAHRPAYLARREVLLGEAAALGLELIPPEGAFYALLRLPPALAADSLGAAERLLDERRVVAVPGRAFGASGEGWLRISWVAAEDRLAEGLRRIAGFFRAAAA
jgi:aspartate/methionine/tyrosine aminotransferase